MQNLDSDIIVVGAGGCGLITALVATKKSARMLLLETIDKPGGGTGFSSKSIRASVRRRQRELTSTIAWLCMRRIFCGGTTARAMPS